MEGLTEVFPTDSQPNLASTMDSSAPSLGMPPQGAEVSCSSQGRGVGLFALSTSPSDSGLSMDDQIKDPKVCLWVFMLCEKFLAQPKSLHWHLFQPQM